MPVLVNSESQLAEDLTPEAAQIALQTGSHLVPLLDPNGQAISYPFKDAQELISRGYTQPNDEQLSHLLKIGKYSTPEQLMKGFTERAASSATLGLSTGAERALGVSPQAIRGRREALEEYPVAEFAADTLGAFANPAFKVAGKLGVGIGALAPGRLSKVGEVAGRLGAEMGTFTLGDEVSKAFSADPNQSIESAIANIGISGAFGALAGGVLGSIKPTWKAFAESSLGEKLVGARQDAEAIKTINPIVKKAVSTFFNVPEKLIDDYMINREAIASVAEYDVLHAHGYDYLIDLQERLQSAKISEKEAVEEVKALRDRMMNSLKDAKFEAKAAEKDASEILKVASADAKLKNLNEAIAQGPIVHNAVESLQDRVIQQSKQAFDLLFKAGEGTRLNEAAMTTETLEKILADLKMTAETFQPGGLIKNEAGEVIGRYAPTNAAPSYIRELKQPTKRLINIVEKKLSGKSVTAGQESLLRKMYGNSGYDPLYLEIGELDFPFGENLAKTSKKVPLEKTLMEIDEIRQELIASAGLENQTRASKLAAYAENLKNIYGKEIHPAAAKKVIQALDEVTTYKQGAIEFDAGMNPYWKKIRFALDDDLKNAIPEYREAMKPVAKETAFLKKFKAYDTPEKAIRSIKGLTAADKYMIQMPLLRELEATSNQKFINTIERYANPKLRQALRSAMPEQIEYDMIARVMQELQNPSTVRAIEKKILESPEMGKLNLKQLERAITEVEAGKVKGLTPATLQGKMRAAQLGKKEAQRLMSELPQLEGKDINELLKYRAIKDAFEKGAMHGSRNVNLLGGILGGIAGLLGGHIGSLIGMVAGVASGAFVDKSGPAMAKRVLDFLAEKHGIGGKLVDDASPSAVRIALGKLLSSAAPVSAAAFKAAVQTATHAIEGEREAQKASEAVLKPGAFPVKDKTKNREVIKKKITEFQQNPDKMLNIAGDMNDYFPDHAVSLAAVAMRAMQYIESQKPKTNKLSPFDRDMVPSKAQEAVYNRAIDIAENPLLVLEAVKRGTVTHEDVKAMASMYPALYENVKGKLLTEALTANANGVLIPYKTKLGISLFIGQALDSTMQPMALMMTQFQMPNVAQTGMAPPKGKSPKTTGANFGKSAQLYSTAGDVSQQRKLTKV